MERVHPLEPPHSPEVAEELRKLMPPGMEPIRLFRVVARNPRVLSRMRRGSLLSPGSISIRERELVILRTTALCRAEYEWGVHVGFFAGAAGLSEEEVRATYTGERELFPPRERVLFELSDELHERAELSDASWRALSAHYREEQIIELLALAGQYHAVSYLTNGLRLELEAHAPRFPAATGRSA